MIACPLYQPKVGDRVTLRTRACQVTALVQAEHHALGRCRLSTFTSKALYRCEECGRGGRGGGEARLVRGFQRCRPCGLANRGGYVRQMTVGTQHRNEFAGAEVRAWSADLHAAGDAHANCSGIHMEWTVHYFDKRMGRETVSRVFSSEHDALRHACDLERSDALRIPTIVTSRSDESRPPVPIDRDQCDGAVRCIC
jgi:hypothetical protein